MFIDELDSIGAKRLDVATSGDREVQRTLMQLLAELDGFNPLADVKIIGATNRPDILDEALLRPGRFDRIIEIPIPNYEGRLAIFKIQMKKIDVDDTSSPSSCGQGRVRHRGRHAGHLHRSGHVRHQGQPRLCHRGGFRKGHSQGP